MAGETQKGKRFNLIPADSPFVLTGPAKLIGVGNGNPSCHEPDKADSRSTFNGLAQALVQTTNTAGKIVLRAEFHDLDVAVLIVHSH